MNILLSSYSFGAGRGSEAGVGWNVAKGLALRGHTVTVLTTSEFSTGNRSAIEQEELNITLIEEDYGISDFPEPGSYRKWQQRVRSFLRNLANTQAFDLIHHITLNQYRWVHDVFSTGTPYIIGPVGGAELIPPHLLKYGDLPLRMRIKEHLRSFAHDAIPLKNRCLRCHQPGMILTSNDATAERLSSIPVQSLVCPAIAIAKSEIVHHPANNAEEKRFILFDGSLTRPQKGTLLALRTLAALWQKGCRVTMRMVALTPPEINTIRKYAEKLRLPAEALELSEYVHRDTMLQYMSEAAVMLSCTFRDSGCMALLEALARGCRIVCLDIPSQKWLPEQFCHKVAVQPTSSAMEEALTSALQQEIAAPANTEEWHKSRVQWIEQNMTWDARLDTFEELYRQILSKKPSA